MPLLQVFLSHTICSLGARFGGARTHGEPPHAILLIIPEAKNWVANWKLDWFSCRTSPKLGLDLNSGTLHSINVHAFFKTRVPNDHLGPSEWSMNIIKSKTARGVCPLLPPQRGDVPPFANPPVHFMADSWLVACQITQHCRLNNLALWYACIWLCLPDLCHQWRSQPSSACITHILYLTLSCRSTCAPVESKTPTVSLLPWELAHIRAVMPS